MTEIVESGKPWNFHTCKFCWHYRSKSDFIMFRHIKQHVTRPKTDTFICESKTPELYECEFCDFQTSLKVDLNEHIGVLHEEKDVLEKVVECYHCKDCNFQTYSLLVLLKHTALKEHGSINKKKENTINEDHLYKCISPEGVTWWKCKHCLYENRVKGQVKSHTLRHLAPEHVIWFQCKQCPHKTKYRNALNRHIAHRHTDPKYVRLYPCEHCIYQAKDKSRLKKHFLAKHASEENWIKCLHCPFKAKEKSNLRSHMLFKHTDSEDITWFRCEHCSYKGKKRSCLKRHLLSRHTSRGIPVGPVPIKPKTSTVGYICLDNIAILKM